MTEWSVTGLDRSPQMIRLARASAPGNITFVEADYFHGTSLDEGKYDFLGAVAVVHHAEFEDAVGELVTLLAPGGRLVIGGMACNRKPLDWVISGCGLPVGLFRARRNGGKRGPVGMTVEDSAMCWGEARKSVRRMLPGARFRRRLLWRYVAVWDKPVA